jgi:hypothetical protein
VVAITLVASSAAAHVAPSVDDNNRYLKLTPLGDRVRLAYTVFFGEIPGASERRTIDRNHDGRIDDGEARAFAGHLGSEVAAALDIDIDGASSTVTWAMVEPGMGTPTVDAGSFSVDLVAYLCLPTVRGKHRLVVRDRFRLTHPGETEVKVEDGLGVTIERARIGAADDPSYDYRFAGGGGPLQDDGLELVFVASDKAPVTSDGACTGTHASRAGAAARRWVTPVMVIGGMLGAIAITVIIVVRRRRRSLRPSATTNDGDASGS